MKKLLRNIFIVCALFSSLLYSTTRIVDGTGGGGKYATLTAALSAAAANDTISILAGTYTTAMEGSATVTVGKKVVIIGNGYKGSNNLVKTIIRYSIDVQQANVKLSGFLFSGSTTITFNDQTSGCVVSDCMFDGSRLYIYNSTSDTVRNNLFRQNDGSYGFVYAYGTSSNIVIANNVFDGIASTTTYGVQTGNSANNILVLNNHFDNLYYPLYPTASGNNSSLIIVGNIFVKGATISAYNNSATLYIGNWLYNTPTNVTQPNNGSNNGSGSPQFEGYDDSKGFVYTGDQSTDTDLRIKSTASPFPNSPIDGSFPPVAPFGPGYVDVLQQPGTVNTNRADIGIFGGPFPFPSPFTPSTIPSASIITITPNPVGPKGSVTVTVTGGFGN